jgi:hypothetical protein
MIGITILFTVSCAKEYTYSPPESAAGKVCVSTCQTNQNKCRQQELNRVNQENQQCQTDSKKEFNICEEGAQKEFEQCEHDANIDFKACQRYAPTLSARGACVEDSCFKKTCFERSCYNTASYDFCDSEFRGCFQQCGGTVGVMK